MYLHKVGGSRGPEEASGLIEGRNLLFLFFIRDTVVSKFAIL